VGAFFSLHWSSLLMLLMAIPGIIAYILMIKREFAIASRSKEKPRHSHVTMAVLFVILFLSAIALFIVECFSARWGILFTIIRLAVMVTHFIIAGFLIYFCINNIKRFQKLGDLEKS
jgi:hypothetical protein